MPKTYVAKTPQPIVILGTGRSFTSVINCMIGQHPQMIGLPETNIFRDDTLGAVYDRYSEGGNAWAKRISGLLRTLAYFHDGEQTDETIDAAERFVLEHRDWSSTQIARYITKIAGPRGIVEKSISTCRDATGLALVHQAWPDAFYIHITRQPESIIQSMQSRIDGVGEGLRKRFGKILEEVNLDEYYVSLTSTILEFMATLPPGRAMNLHGEDFLNDARPYARQICEWTGLDTSDSAIEEMMHPERNPFATLGPAKAPRGMSKTFLENPTYSGKPVTPKPLTLPNQPNLSTHQKTMVSLANRLGYV